MPLHDNTGADIWPVSSQDCTDKTSLFAYTEKSRGYLALQIFKPANSVEKIPVLFDMVFLATLNTRFPGSPVRF